MTALENFPWTTTEHCERYCQLVKSQQTLLRCGWDDLELTADDQISSLKGVALRAEDVWRDALRQIESQRASLREQIQEAESRVNRLKSELSDESFPGTEVQILTLSYTSHLIFANFVCVLSMADI